LFLDSFLGVFENGKPKEKLQFQSEIK